jgi:DNA replication protein DnaC
MTSYNDNNTTKTTDHDNSSNGYANSCNQTSEMPAPASTLILDSMLKGLSLLTIKEVYGPMAEQAEKLRLTYTGYLYELVQSETEQRHQKNVLHLLRLAKLPRNKLLLDFDISRIPGLHPGLVKTLSEGAFIDRCENLLFFGNPGTGKTHLTIALAREWCLQGRKCLYINAASLVQQLITAKLNNKLSNLLKSLDKKEVLIIDDISYVPYDKAETDLLFLLLAERYEQRSTVITSNIPFSGWNQVFKDEMTTAAAIDRLVHHATILELNTESYRITTAKKQHDYVVSSSTKSKTPDDQVTKTQTNSAPEKEEIIMKT